MTTPAKRDPTGYLLSRLWRRSHIDRETGCWVWDGATSGKYGHGMIRVEGDRTTGTHRAAYEALVGPIPAGLHIDHLCRNPPCWNPAHLEPVTPKENAVRSPINQAAWQAARDVTHCPKGHAYSPENTVIQNGSRHCRECRRAAHRAREMALASNCVDCGTKLKSRTAKRCRACHPAHMRAVKAAASSG